MTAITTPQGHHRREFLRLLGAGAVGAAVFRNPAFSAEEVPRKAMRGIFPIMQTPFTDSDKLDLEVLAREVQFLDRCGVHGMVWPQLASEYATLTVEERLSGAEAIVTAGKALRPAIVIGVQAPDIPSAVKYARHAEKIGADAIIALPPPNPADVERYYHEIGKAASLPLFMQTTGNMSVDLVFRLAKEIPTLRFIKDEAGHTLSRITEFRKRRAELDLRMFTGNHGRTLLDELARGSSGTMPAAAFIDLYVRVWDLWHAEKQEQAREMFSKILLLVSEAEAYGIASLKYLLQLRGIFTTSRTRLKEGSRLDEEARRSLQQTYEFVRPYFKA